MFPSGGILQTLMILWLFIWRLHQVNTSMCQWLSLQPYFVLNATQPLLQLLNLLNISVSTLARGHTNQIIWLCKQGYCEHFKSLEANLCSLKSVNQFAAVSHLVCKSTETCRTESVVSNVGEVQHHEAVNCGAVNPIGFSVVTPPAGLEEHVTHAVFL